MQILYLFFCHLPTVCLSEDGQKKQQIHYERIQEITEYIDARSGISFHGSKRQLDSPPHQ